MEARFKQCSIEGCERKLFGLGFCNMHYLRVRAGIDDMRPSPLPRVGWAWNKRPRKGSRFCSVEGCHKTYYAKGLCRAHWGLNRRNGAPAYKKILFPNPKCKVLECTKQSKVKGYCTFHYTRFKNGKDVNCPKGNSGPLNHNWNGGVSQYPNHTQMKRIRKIVLKEENYTCFYCGKPTKQIHHIDETKSNHARSNLHACCHSCNLKFVKHHQSKYSRAYGKKLSEIIKLLHVDAHKIAAMHRNGTLRQALYMDEIQSVLF